MLLENKDIGIYNLFLRKNLSKNRYTHSINVANEAVKLAVKYNGNKHQALLAGLLHDVCKEMPLLNQRELVEASKLQVSETEKASQPLWHAIAGAEFIKTQFGIDDNDIINAIRYHTAARANMSQLEMIIYLADLVSIDREYKEVKKMRKLAYTNLEKAMLEALKFSINESIFKESTIPSNTFEAYNQFTQLNK